jgi:preprotein translocase subunit YajC
MTATEWRGVLIALAIFVAMFGFPIITLWRDERRKRRAEDNLTAQQPQSEQRGRTGEYR